jgi:hypothetical protein
LENIGYIGYRSPAQIGFGEATLATGGALAPVTLVLDAAIALAPFLIPWVSGIFAHPAKDALGVISAVKPTLVNLPANKRMASVLAATQKISDKAKDVEAEKWLLWYRQNYSSDYTMLTPEEKIYFNNYLFSVRNRVPDGNNMYANLQAAMFTDAEVNYNATPSSILTSLTTGANTKYILYGAIALGLYLLTKK